MAYVLFVHIWQYHDPTEIRKNILDGKLVTGFGLDGKMGAGFSFISYIEGWNSEYIWQKIDKNILMEQGEGGQGLEI